MKVQELIARAMSGPLSWLDAAAILRGSPRTLRRWRRRYERYGHHGLFAGASPGLSPRRVRLQLAAVNWRANLAKCRVKVCAHVDRVQVLP